MSTRPAVYATGVTVTAGRHRLIDGCDLTVGHGDWITVVGPNGAGKTTLLRAVAGLVPAAGRIELDGRPVASLRASERAGIVALVPQAPVVPPGMTVAHYVLLGRTARLGALGREAASDRAAVDRVLGLLDLDDLAGRALDTLSGGERQRVVLGRALAQEASILLLDEPTSALDIAHQQAALELVDSLRRRLGLTVVSTMHDLTLAAQYADHLVLLAGGRTTLSGPPAQLLTKANLERHYGGDVEVLRHRGRLVVVPWRPESEEDVEP